MSGAPTGTERSVNVRCSVAFGLAAALALGFSVTYVVSGSTRLEGLFAGLALVSLAVGLVTWGLSQIVTVQQEREPMYDETSRTAERAVKQSLGRAAEPVDRRSFIKYLGAAAGAFGVAAAMPLASLGPRPKNRLAKTSWAPGSLAVTEGGDPIHAADVEEGSMTTIFPEGNVGSADAQAVLLRLSPQDLALPATRQDWTPLGLVAYSRVCTHAGCPVAQYQAESKQLLCPCHQSLFDVTTGAKPVFGPAPRPLPQLPLTIDGDGLIRAVSDFHTPVGPAFWSFP